MRQQLSVPVSVMVIVIGAVLSYYVLHVNGWSWNGTIALADVYRRLTTLSRVAVIAGFALNAWGLGSFLNALLAKRKSNDELPPSA